MDYRKRGGNIILEIIKKEIKLHEEMLKTSKQQSLLLPKGTLRCTSSNGADQYYVDGEYVSKRRKDYVQEIAQREYYEKMIPILEHNLRTLKDMEDIYEKQALTACYEKSCSARKKIVVPMIDPIENKIRKFQEEKYPPGEFDENNRTEFYTRKGERVRSKSELIIAEELQRYQVPYLYEKPLEFKDWNRNVILRPDFTVMNCRTGKIIIYEHLGKMDDPEYVERNIHKLDLYERNGYLLGRDLLITHETKDSPLNVGVLDSYIREYFL